MYKNNSYTVRATTVILFHSAFMGSNVNDSYTQDVKAEESASFDNNMYFSFMSAERKEVI